MKELYLIDTPNSYVHVFDISGLPDAAPKRVADIPLSPAMGGTEEGWLLTVGDGRYLVVGDSGDVIDTTTRTIAYYLPTVNNTRKFLEIDWQNGHPIFTTSRIGMGYVGVPAGTATTTPLTPETSSPTPGPSSTVTITPTATASPTASPTPGNVIAQDNFTRASQQFWGTASDGLTWGGDANSQGAFSIHNNVGQIADGSEPYNAVLGPVESDADVLATGSMSSFVNNNLGEVLRWADNNDWYKAYINGTQLVVQKKVQGVATILSQTAFTATPNTPYNLRFEVVGTTLYAKAWAADAAEPTAWNITTTDSALSSGQCGLRIQVLGATSANVTSFVATSIA